MVKRNEKALLYILAAMEQMEKNGDTCCDDGYLFRACCRENAKLTSEQYHQDKSALIRKKLLYLEGSKIYLKRTWDYEAAAANCLADILSNNVTEGVVLPDPLICGDVTLSSQQREAIATALSSRLSMILGGAGSGKTTLIRAMVKVAPFPRYTVVAAAPTGKAARNLTERTGIQARTIHSALGKVPDENFLDPVCWEYVHLIVIDEASMMSLEMLAGILNRVSKDCRIVLLGDPNQLLAVGAGNVLSDLQALDIPVTYLEQQYRQSESAEALRYNVVEFPKLRDVSEFHWDDSFRLIPASDAEIAKIVCHEAAKRYLAGESVQVLSMTNYKTAFSAADLNRGIQNLVNPLAEGALTWGNFRNGDRIIVLKNDSEQDLSNGDVGLLLLLADTAILSLEHRAGMWSTDYPPKDLALAYALTVHKSQGSQYDTVILPVSTATAKMLYRNLLYTAISRAKKQVILVGSKEAIHVAMQVVPHPRRSKLVAKTRMLLLQRTA